MSTIADTVESMLFRSDATFDQLDPTTWILNLDNRYSSQVIIKVEDPIVLFSLPIGVIGAQVDNRETLYRTLLELNDDFLHNSYAINGSRLVLSAALQTENLDANEFQAVIDDLTLNLDNHLEKLSNWKFDDSSTAEA